MCFGCCRSAASHGCSWRTCPASWRGPSSTTATPMAASDWQAPVGWVAILLGSLHTPPPPPLPQDRAGAEQPAVAYVVGELEKLGYNWAQRIVDTRAFGLPQRRRCAAPACPAAQDCGRPGASAAWEAMARAPSSGMWSGPRHVPRSAGVCSSWPLCTATREMCSCPRQQPAVRAPPACVAPAVAARGHMATSRPAAHIVCARTAPPGAPRAALALAPRPPPPRRRSGRLRRPAGGALRALRAVGAPGRGRAPRLHC